MNGKSASGLSNVAAVVCARNVEKTIGECLKSLRDSGIKSIVLVDGNSTDKTIEAARPYSDKILIDPGTGLAEARNIGIAEVDADFVLNFGADNILTFDCLSRMLAELNEDGVAGVSCMTYMRDSDNYICKAQNLYKRARYYPGYRSVIGTPNIFSTKLLKENTYDPVMGHSDDGDLCVRLQEKGYKFKIANAVTYEIGFENIDGVLERWRRYGLSDYQTFKKYSPDWNLIRKIKSILHPVRVEIIQPYRRLAICEFLYAAPFLMFITAVRYAAWFNKLVKRS